MQSVYHTPPVESMRFSRWKHDLSRIRQPDEILIPISDTSRVLGWALVPLADYVKTRYTPMAARGL